MYLYAHISECLTIGGGRGVETNGGVGKQVKDMESSYKLLLHNYALLAYSVNEKSENKAVFILQNLKINELGGGG